MKKKVEEKKLSYLLENIAYEYVKEFGLDDNYNYVLDSDKDRIKTQEEIDDIFEYVSEVDHNRLVDKLVQEAHYQSLDEITEWSKKVSEYVEDNEFNEMVYMLSDENMDYGVAALKAIDREADEKDVEELRNSIDQELNEEFEY